MKNKELMVGDLVSCDLETFKPDRQKHLCCVEEITEVRTDIIRMGVTKFPELSNVEPISISSDFLLDNGFDDISEENRPLCFYNIIDTENGKSFVHIMKSPESEDKWRVKISQPSESFTNILRLEISYIHELQNAFNIFNIEYSFTWPKDKKLFSVNK